ncbi:MULTISPECIES: NAD(P)/FAD-dependent oxidoreductase [Paenibacillus]|uniref:NAD(P)/FAD-dependent oxidoreductase n=1 Tax=Paenibacillus TaxID=44249 RepID=UPI0022B88BBA|nr:FAD-dependent oxidoreductase [Paenibacillus caseinilyticus]MCZ8520490.1 FAD-dependent oxidoreductase [Paenibacillus caseinilyticus]
MNRVWDAAVIGAGIGGSAAAMALARQGWDVLLLDARRFPRHKVCGEFLSPESRSMLQALGFGEAAASLGPVELDRARLFWGEGGPLTLPLPGKALGISRYALDPALHAELRRAGGTVLTGAPVTSMQAEGDGYRIEVKGAAGRLVLRARTVIGAWGGGGSKLSGGRAPVSDFIGVKSHLTNVAADSAVELYVVPGGYIGIAPVENGAANVAALLDKTAFAAAGLSAGELLLAAAAGHPQLREKLAAGAAVPGTEAAVIPRLGRRPKAWDGCALVGDACVTIPPLCGDGMSMALRSALLCSGFADGFLRGSLSAGQWRVQYERRLLRDFAGPLRWGHLLQGLFARPALAGPLMAVARLAPLLPALLLRATRLKETERQDM